MTMQKRSRSSVFKYHFSCFLRAADKNRTFISLYLRIITFSMFKLEYITRPDPHLSHFESSSHKIALSFRYAFRFRLPVRSSHLLNFVIFYRHAFAPALRSVRAPRYRSVPNAPFLFRFHVNYQQRANR